MKIHVVLFAFTTCVLAFKASEARRQSDEKQSKSPEKWPLNPQLQRTTLNGKSSRKVDRALAQAGWDLINRNERKSRKRSRANKQLRMGILQTRSAIGPQGPRGPPGPMGPKGANVPKDEILEEIRTMFNDATHQKILDSLRPERCTELCFQSLDDNGTNIIEDRLKILHENVLVPKIMSAFMWENDEYITLPKQSRVELDMFKESEKQGAYGRDVGYSRPDTGKFVAPRSGFYNFNARIHLQLPVQSNDKHISTKNLVSVSICIDSKCGDKMALEAISGFGPGERMTITVGGMLYLKLNQYVSLFIENASEHPISIFDGSQFTGYLIGV